MPAQLAAAARPTAGSGTTTNWLLWSVTTQTVPEVVSTPYWPTVVNPLFQGTLP